MRVIWGVNHGSHHLSLTFSLPLFQLNKPTSKQWISHGIQLSPGRPLVHTHSHTHSHIHSLTQALLITRSLVKTHIPCKVPGTPDPASTQLPPATLREGGERGTGHGLAGESHPSLAVPHDSPPSASRSLSRPHSTRLFLCARARAYGYVRGPQATVLRLPSIGSVKGVYHGSTHTLHQSVRSRVPKEAGRYVHPTSYIRPRALT